jgi:hypothetical protein
VEAQFAARTWWWGFLFRGVGLGIGGRLLSSSLLLLIWREDGSVSRLREGGARTEIFVVHDW